MAESSADSADTRLRLLLANPEILNASGVDQLYEDLETVDTALMKIRESMDHTDPKFAQVDVALGELRNATAIGCYTEDLEIDDLQGAHEWRQERKTAAIQALFPALAFLGELACWEAAR